MNILPFYSPFNLDFLYLEFRISYISSFETKFILLPLFQNNLFLSSQILLIKTFSSRTNFLIYSSPLEEKVSDSTPSKDLASICTSISLEAKETHDRN